MCYLNDCLLPSDALERVICIAIQICSSKYRPDPLPNVWISNFRFPECVQYKMLNCSILYIPNMLSI